MVQPGRTPLHIQLADIIRDQIKTGAFRPGDQLPTENELMRQHDLSSSTVRQAVLSLVREGLLFRRAGKGTFVAKRHIGRDLLSFSGFSEEAVARGFRPGTRQAKVAWGPANNTVAAALSIAPGDRVLTVERLRTIDDEVVALEVVSLPEALGVQLERFNLADISLTAALESDLHIALVRAKQDIRGGIARGALAKALDAQGGSAVLEIDRTAFDGGDAPVYFSASVYRADRYIYTGWIERKPNVAGQARQLSAKGR
jgi:GntR family transcriptional regulator